MLRALVEILATQAATLRRSDDRLWDDVFIDLCDDWAVPYLGDLVGTRLVSALDTRGRRVDVAKTIYYRRRKGTPRVLEELIGDITGWDGTVIESFPPPGAHAPRARPGAGSARWPLLGNAARRVGRSAPAVRVDARRRAVRRVRAHRRTSGGSTDRTGRWNIPKLVFHPLPAARRIT